MGIFTISTDVGFQPSTVPEGDCQAAEVWWCGLHFSLPWWWGRLAPWYFWGVVFFQQKTWDFFFEAHNNDQWLMKMRPWCSMKQSRIFVRFLLGKSFVMIEPTRLHVPRSNQGNELHHAFILLPTSTLHSTARTFHRMHRGTVRPSQALHSRTLNRFAVADGEVKSDQSCHKCQQHLESYLSFGADGSWKIFWMWAFWMSHFMQSISFNWDYNSTQEDEKHLLKGACSRFLLNSSSGHEKWLWKSSGTGWHCTSSFLDEQSWLGENKIRFNTSKSLG